MSPQAAQGSPDSAARARLLTQAAQKRLAAGTGGDETAVLYAAEAVRQAQDGPQQTAALAVLQAALRRLSGHTLRIFGGTRDPDVPPGRPDEITAVTMSRDGGRVAAGTAEGLLYVWQAGREGAATPLTLLAMPPVPPHDRSATDRPPVREPVARLQFLFHDRWLAVATSWGNVRVRDTAHGFAEAPVPPSWQDNTAWAASPDSGWFGVVGREGHAVEVWRLKDGAPHLEWSAGTVRHPVRSLAFSGDGTQVFLMQDAREMRILESATGRLIRALALPATERTLERHERGTDVSPRGPPAVTADLSPGGRVLLVTQTQPVRTVYSRSDGFESIYESVDRQQWLWDLSGAHPVPLPGCFPFTDGAVREELTLAGRWLAATAFDWVGTRDLSASPGAPCHTLRPPGGPAVTGMSLDAKGQLAVGTTDGTVLVWRLGGPVSSGPPGVIPALPVPVPTLSGDGRRMRMISAAGFRTPRSLLRLADLADGPAAEPPAPGADRAQWQALARSRIARNLTLQEWRDVLGEVPYERTFPDIDDTPLVQSLLDQAGGQRQAGQAQAARATLQRALQAATASGNPFALTALVLTGFKERWPDLAAAAADALLQRLPEDPAALAYRGQARALRGEVAAVRDLERYLSWARSRGAPPEALQWEEDAIRLLRQGQRPPPRQ